MTEPSLYRSLIEELDARQNEVLDELARLEETIEKTVAEWTRKTPEQTQPAAAPANKAA